MDWNRPASEIILLEAKNQVSEISDGEERKFQKDKSVSSTYDWKKRKKIHSKCERNEKMFIDAEDIITNFKLSGNNKQT